jgi:hypothetical protein
MVTWCPVPPSCDACAWACILAIFLLNSVFLYVRRRAEARQDEGLVFMPCPTAPRRFGPNTKQSPDTCLGCWRILSCSPSGSLIPCLSSPCLVPGAWCPSLFLHLSLSLSYLSSSLTHSSSLLYFPAGGSTSLTWMRYPPTASTFSQSKK